MYPLLELGPIRLSTSGLVLLIAAYWWTARFSVAAAAIGGVQWVERAERCIPAVLAGSIIGARLWYGLLNWDAYLANPWLFLALRFADVAWPGGLIGAAIGLLLAARRVKAAAPILADAALLALGPPQSLAAFGLLLSGEALGVPTDLPWAISLLGASRHPTQLYYSLAAALTWLIVRAVARHYPIPAAPTAAALALQGLAWLLIEPLRADSLLLPGGIRAAQVAGLCLLVGVMWYLRRTYSTSRW